MAWDDERVKRLLGLLAVVIAVAAPVPARASCASPQPFVAPADGSMLPRDPTVFLFVPAFLAGEEFETEIDVSIDGRSASYWPELVSASPAFHTYRITIATGAGSDLLVRAAFRIGEAPFNEIESRHRVADVEPPDFGVESAMARPERAYSSWMCSYQSTWNLRPQVDAPAYRVEWAATREAYDGGARSTVVLPGRMGGFWTYPGRDPAPAPAEVQLGHADCMDHTMVWPGAHAWVGVWALLPDGREVALTDEPIRLTKPPEG
jgi:hypothetical protein